MIRGSYPNILGDYHNHHNPTREILWTNRWQQVDLAGCRCRHLGSSRMFLRNLCTWSRSNWETMRNWYIPENSKCMVFFADLGFRQNFQISLLKTAFGGIPSLETNFGGIDCWMFALVKSENMSADFGGIARNFGGISWTQLWLQIYTAHHSPLKPYFGRIENCRHFFLFSAIFLEFGDSCAEM